MVTDQTVPVMPEVELTVRGAYKRAAVAAAAAASSTTVAGPLVPVCRLLIDIRVRCLG